MKWILSALTELHARRACGRLSHLRQLGGLGFGSASPPSFIASSRSRYNIASYLAVRRAVRTKKPDLVYERYSSFSFGGMLASVRAGIPVILEVNLTYTGAFGSDHPVHFMSIARKIESFAFRRSTGIAVVSEPLRTSLVEMGGAKEKIIVTRNAINDAFVKSFDIDRTRHEIRSQLGWTDNLIVGFVGSLRSWHGVDLLMGAIPDV